MHRRPSILVLVGVLVTLLAAGATAAAVGLYTGYPTSASELRALRSGAPRDMLELVYDAVDRETGRQRQTIMLVGSDFVAVEDGGRRNIYDFRLGRAFFYDTARRSFSNISLIGLAESSRVELAKRRLIAELAGGKPAQPELDALWVETDLRIKGLAAAGLRRIERGGELIFQIGDTEVARLVPSAEHLPPTLRPRAARAWRYLLPLHAELAAALGREPVPQSLTLVHPVDGRLVTTDYRLKAMRQVQADYPLPRDAAALAPGTAEFSPIAQALLQAVRAAKPVPAGEYRARFQAALRRGAHVEALLWWMDWDATWGSPCGAGDERCQQLDQLMAAGRDDERLRLVSRLLNQPPSEQALALIDQIKQDDLPNAHVLDMVKARITGGLALRPGRAEDVQRLVTETERLLTRAIAGNPYSTAAVDEAGRFYERLYRPYESWLIWDLGRQLPNRFDEDRLSYLDLREASLRRDDPDLF